MVKIFKELSEFTQLRFGVKIFQTSAHTKCLNNAESLVVFLFVGWLDVGRDSRNGCR